MTTINSSNNPQLTTNGQLIIGSTGAFPVAATLTAGSGVTITNGAGSITIAASGAGMTWSTVSGTTQTIAANTGYVANNASVVTFTLPASASVGDTFAIVGLGAGGWTIAQNSGQLIRFGNQVTTTGVSGTLSSSNQYDTVLITCIVTNTTWSVRSVQGNLTYV